MSSSVSTKKAPKTTKKVGRVFKKKVKKEEEVVDINSLSIDDETEENELDKTLDDEDEKASIENYSELEDDNEEEDEPFLFRFTMTGDFDDRFWKNNSTLEKYVKKQNIRPNVKIVDNLKDKVLILLMELQNEFVKEDGSHDVEQIDYYMRCVFRNYACKCASNWFTSDTINRASVNNLRSVYNSLARKRNTSYTVVVNALQLFLKEADHYYDCSANV